MGPLTYILKSKEEVDTYTTTIACFLEFNMVMSFAKPLDRGWGRSALEETSNYPNHMAD
jgi:hypothetical protein